MAKVKGAIVVDTENCKGCALCVEACPTNAISLSEEVNGRGYNFAEASDPGACIGCANCSLVCPDSCITVYKSKVLHVV
ncbi:MAG: 4Fe-4S dicluster domain-containing protein [Bacteroidales bacterium]|jgi:2-oxoglutarate ferredoxin oxidoreductase subunit delta